MAYTQQFQVARRLLFGADLAQLTRQGFDRRMVRTLAQRLKEGRLHISPSTGIVCSTSDLAKVLELMARGMPIPDNIPPRVRSSAKTLYRRYQNGEFGVPGTETRSEGPSIPPGGEVVREVAKMIAEQPDAILAGVQGFSDALSGVRVKRFHVDLVDTPGQEASVEFYVELTLPPSLPPLLSNDDGPDPG